MTGLWHTDRVKKATDASRLGETSHSKLVCLHSSARKKFQINTSVVRFPISATTHV